MLGNCKLVSVPPCKKVKEKKNPSLPKKQKGNALLRKQKKKIFPYLDKHIQIVPAATNAKICHFCSDA